MLEEADAPVALDSILCTEELARRPLRSPELEKEIRALIGLIQAMVDSPNDILQKLADTICEMLGCGSAGISLLTSDGGTRFYWPAISGIWKPHIGGGIGSRPVSYTHLDVYKRQAVYPPGNWFAPPGSNQSSSGGNETAEASGAEGGKGEFGACGP